MERLTFEGNFCDIAQCRENPCPYNGSCSQREVWEKLKAYEDTRLEPDEIPDNHNQKELATKVNDLYDEDGGDIFPEGQKKNEPLTQEELRKMVEATPVWWDHLTKGGFWCLAQTGIIMVPSGMCYDISECAGQVYRHKPAGGEG